METEKDSKTSEYIGIGDLSKSCSTETQSACADEMQAAFVDVSCSSQNQELVHDSVENSEPHTHVRNSADNSEPHAHVHDSADNSNSHPHVHDSVENSNSHPHAHPHVHEPAENSNSHPHAHPHVHDPAEKKRQLNRISRIIGHLEYVKRMMEDDEDCSDVLMQISASKSALNGLGKSIIKEHMSHCIVHAIEDGDVQAVEEFQEAIQKYL